MRALPDSRGRVVLAGGGWWALAMMGWLTLVLLLDRADGDGSLLRQRLLGVATWCVLAAVLVRCSPLVRAQAVVVVALATCVEYLFSPTLEVYLYRFENVPAYVPPGHGLVYLSAWALGSTRLVQRHLRVVVPTVLAVSGAWAVHGWAFADRPDGLGFFWWVCLAAFLLVGPSTGVYVGAFVVVSHLELVGTALGTWAWQVQDPLLGVTIGNPPSGAAGGYGWFDLVALLVAPRLLALAQASGVGSAGRRRSSCTEPEDRAAASGSPSESATPPR